VVGGASIGSRAGVTVFAGTLTAAGAVVTVVAVDSTAGAIVVVVVEAVVVAATADSASTSTAGMGAVFAADPEGSSDPQDAATPARPTSMAITRNRT